LVNELEDIPMQHVNAFHEKTALVTKDGQIVMWGNSRNGGIVDAKGHSFKSNLLSPTIFDSETQFK
jgi:hypothetical protein